MQKINSTQELLNKIALEMKSKGILHRHLAENLGVSRQRVTRLLLGHQSPSTDQIIKICKILNINIYAD